MVLVQSDLALVQLGHPRLDRVELGLCDLAAHRRLPDRIGESLRLTVDRFQARTHRVDLTGEPGQALTAVRLGSDSGQVLALRLRDGSLLGRQLGLRGGQLLGDRFQLRDQQSFLLGHALRLRLQLFRIRSSRRGDDFIEVAGPLARDPDRGADPFGERRESEPGLLGQLGLRHEFAQCRLVLGQQGGGHVELLADLRVLLAQRRLGIVGPVEVRPASHQVIGGQTQSCIAQIGLHGGGAARNFRLAAKGFELPTQFGGEVGEPGQVGGHRLELADRLFLALTVLEHTGRFLDEGATILRSRFQDLRQAPLSDDDVHFPADARVGQQLLDVHQPAALAVDLVLTGAVPEHPTGDRHLGVFDRQRMVGVVDRQGHFGTAQRSAGRRPRENDVFHLAAAQGLGALFAHHPGQGIYNIGLTRTIGADDAGDTRLQTQSRRRSKGLEALQRQTLEVHSGPEYRSWR